MGDSDALGTVERLAGLGYWSWDLTCERITWSAGMFRLFGYDEAVERHVPLELPLERVHPEDRATVRASIERFVESGVVTPLEYRILLPDGSVRVVSSEAEPVRDREGRVVRAIGVVQDVTARVEARESLRASAARFATLYHAIPLPTVTWRRSGEDFEMSYWNRAAAEYTEGRIGSFAGARASEAFPDSPQLVEDLRTCAETGRVIERELDHTSRAVGSRRRLRVTHAAVSADEVSVCIRDITDRHAAEAALRQRERMLEDAQRLAHVGSWESEIASGEVRWTEETYRIFGCDPGTFTPTVQSVMELVHTEDRDVAGAAAAEALEKGHYDLAHRIVRPSGEVRHIHAVGEYVGAIGDAPARISGAVHDVTEARAAEQSLLSSVEEKEVLLREIHHRVKNNLQVISSLLSMQAAQTDIPDLRRVLGESCERVRAIALVHETLYGSEDLARVDFRAYLERMVAGLSGAHGAAHVKTLVQGRGQAIDIETAVPLGLAISELVVNALRHAFPGGRPGTVRVGFAFDGPEEFRITVEDDGAGLPEVRASSRREGLGLRLVRLLASQLQAELSIGRPESTAGTLATIARSPVAR